MKYKAMQKTIILILLLMVVLSGCGKTDTGSDKDQLTAHKVVELTAGDLEGKRIGVMSGSPQDKFVEKVVKNPDLYYFENNPDEALALESDKIDTFMCVDAIFRYMQPEHPGLIESTLVCCTFQAGVIFPKTDKGEKLRKEMNAYLAEITESGEMQKLKDYWYSEGKKEAITLPQTGKNGTLSGAVTTSIPPYSYLLDGQRAGFDIALLKGFCEKYGYGVKLDEANYTGMVTGTASSKYDLCISIIAWTEERAKSVLFSDIYLEYNMIPIVREDAYPEDSYVLSTSLRTLDGKTAGILTGTPEDEIVNSTVNDVKFQYYNSKTDCALALEEGKIDFYVNNTIQVPFIAKEYPGTSYINRVMNSFDNGAIFPKTDSGAALCKEFNSYLEKAEKDGTLDKLKEYWFKPNEWETIDIPSEGDNGKVRMITCASMKPFSFILNNEYAGFDVAVVADFCRKNGYELIIEESNFSGLISGVSSGKFDMGAGQIAWTQERSKSVLYSDFYAAQLIVPIVKTADFLGDGQESGTDESFLTSIERSFERTFMEESRWKIILEGLFTTMIISVFGFLLANGLGALFCFMALSRRKGLRIGAEIYSRIMQGTPIVAVLMILYYIVFGNSDLSGTVIAIFGFGIVSGAYLAQVFSGGISSIDVGQNEAALSLGMTKKQAFAGIVLPQAVRRMLPGYFSQLITLIKGTSIVGYIAVVDLTKAGDIIRSTTFEAFFPIITSAAIYFLISFILLSIMKRIQKKLAPKRRKASGKEEKPNDIN